jgi:hypothetical protein
LKQGLLERVARGLYLSPRPTRYGNAPATDADIIAALLNDRRFLIVSPNAYNGLGVGTTQLYNTTFVYNHKLRGTRRLAGRLFEFRRRKNFPATVSEEFLLLDLLNNLDRLAEDSEAVLKRALLRIASFDQRRWAEALRRYGTPRSRKLCGSARTPARRKSLK